MGGGAQILPQRDSVGISTHICGSAGAAAANQTSGKLLLILLKRILPVDCLL